MREPSTQDTYRSPAFMPAGVHRPQHQSEAAFTGGVWTPRWVQAKSDFGNEHVVGC